MILAHRAERRERRRSAPVPKAAIAQVRSAPTARLSTPVLTAWQMPQWQRTLCQWPMKPLEATHDIPEEDVKLQAPLTFVGPVPHEVTDEQEVNAVCEEHAVAPSHESEALNQGAEDQQSGLKAEEVSSELLVHLDEQHPKPPTVTDNLSASAEADKESETSSDQVVQGLNKPVEDTYPRQGSTSPESAQCPSPAFPESETADKSLPHALPSSATTGAGETEQCRNIETSLSIGPPSDGQPVPVISDPPREPPSPVREVSRDSDSMLGIVQPLTPPPLELSVSHGNSLHSPSPTYKEQDSHSINPLWQHAMEGLPDGSQRETVSDVVKVAATNELNILSGADDDDDDQTHIASPVARPASVSSNDHADTEHLYEACLAQFTSEFVLR